MTFTFYKIRLPKEYIDKMKLIKKNKYISLAEQIRIAIRDYLEKQ